jgi:phospholipid/cholesterol/gamma-HCH transport system substrate-binding protein
LHDYTKNEIVAGAFVVLGLAVVGYLSISIGGLTLLQPKAYRVLARFSNVGDLKGRAPVKLAGVTVGKVKTIRLADYFGEAELEIDRKVVLPKDTIASISSAGLLGESFISLSPGGAEGNLRDGDRISHTEPAVNVVDLIGKYAFGGKGKGEDEDKDKDEKTQERSKEPPR